MSLNSRVKPPAVGGTSEPLAVWPARSISSLQFPGLEVKMMSISQPIVWSNLGSVLSPGAGTQISVVCMILAGLWEHSSYPSLLKAMARLHHLCKPFSGEMLLA